MSGVGPDVAAWARSHGARYEVGPLMEKVQGRQVRVGFTLTLFARLPLEQKTLAERRAAAAEIWKGLREIVELLMPSPAGGARVEIEAPRPGAVFEAQGQGEPEIEVVARVSHGQGYFTEVTKEEEAKMKAVTNRLNEMGFNEKGRQ